MMQVCRFLKCEAGVTAIEYGLIASAIGMAIVVVVINVGSALTGVFTTVESGLNSSG